ncbi:MAG: ATP-dependent helicase [Clostridiales bacterium]|jgi:hypothetical protein|nr:ATP-dependent helicase [Clostridiales bacterium]HOB63601.1 AAA family ATPase [Clostridia bacterium]
MDVSEFQVNTLQTVLSSECGIHKTQGFIKKTRRFADSDIFVSKIAEGLILALKGKDMAAPKKPDISDCYRIQTTDGEHIFFIKFGFMADSGLPIQPKDIIFFGYIDKENSGRSNDQSFAAYMRMHKTFTCRLIADRQPADPADFRKIYNLSLSDKIYFPLLNEQQKRIVETEDKNVLVQGVAGSGKTNICISKLIFTASRDYHGRTLYTTYSRGLLLDTRERARTYVKNLKAFVSDYKEGRVVFADKNHKRAVEIKFGITFPVRDDDGKIIEKIESICDYLENKVDYFLIEDLYARYEGRAHVADEGYFVKKYAANIKNHQLAGKLNRISHLSHEVIFKEIYGMILGCCDPKNPQKILTPDEYAEKRKDSFNRPECEIIYSLARDYASHLASQGLLDNNIMSRRLLQKADKIEKYSLVIADEVQDMTEVSLCLLKAIGRKLFCVGDALQMINPSYFSFAYLKNLLFEKDAVSVAELKNNYRNTKKIAEIIDKLGQINIGKFGTHSFVLKGECVDSATETSAVFVKDKGFIEGVVNFDNFTVIVGSHREKEELRKILKRQEILTVSEVKGLERDTVILYNLLSDNLDKWQTLERTLLNRKKADENSVYRYYFNLFYVGVSRAKNHLFVAEKKSPPLFDKFFGENFAQKSAPEALKSLAKVAATVETDLEEMVERVRQFINLGQFDNARFAANKISDDLERTLRLQDIDIFEQYIREGNYREAGIRYWELGRPDDAKRQFELSGDATLSELVDASLGSGGQLDIDIIKYYNEVRGNEAAQRLILETVAHDLNRLKDKQKDIKEKLRAIRR